MLLEYREKHEEADHAIRYMNSTLVCCFIAMWIWAASTFDPFGLVMFLFFLFFGCLFSLVAIYKSSFMFTEAYKHIGSEKVGRNLMFGYVIFTVVPAMMIVFMGASAFVLIAAGFYIWNFINDSIMEIMFYSKLRLMKYSIGSDIEASMLALKELKRLLLIKIFVVALSVSFTIGISLTILAFSSDDISVNYQLYSTGLYLSSISMSLLIPSSFVMLKQRLYTASLIPAISMGVNATSMQEIQIGSTENPQGLNAQQPNESIVQQIK